MKKIFTLLLLTSFVLLAYSQESDKSKSSDQAHYVSVAAEINFSGAKIVSESGEEGGNIMRFAPWFNIQFYNNWDGRNTGFFAGFTIRNIGFIYENDNNEKWKSRTYNLGVPVGFKWGDMNGTFMYLGYELELPIHYKEKYFTGETKQEKFTVWFSDRVSTFTHAGFLGFNFKHGFNVKFKYYFTEFFNPDFDNSDLKPSDIRYAGNGLDPNDPDYVAPREYLTVNNFYVALTWNMFRKPYYYYTYDKTEKADQMY